MEIKENTPKAIILIILGMSVIACQDTVIKLISSETNIFLILFVRALLGVIFLSIFLKFRKEPIIFKTHYPVLTILRGLMFFIAFSLYFFSLSKLPLALAVTLFFVCPFFISILSVIFLKETIGLRRWLALIIGFAGVYLVMDPDIDNFNIYTTFPIICAFLYSLTMIIQKKTSAKDNLFSQIFHIYICGIISSLVVLVITGNGIYNNPLNDNFQFLLMSWSINSINILFSLFLIGVVGSIGFLCIFQAYRIGSPPSVAPFEYILIIWSLIISWIIWKETLSLKGFIGLGLIVFAGIYTFMRENKKHVQITIDKPLRR